VHFCALLGIEAGLRQNVTNEPKPLLKPYKSAE